MTQETPQMLEALNHTTRRRILRAFENEGELADATQLAQTLVTPIGAVSYHIGFLVRSGALEPAELEGARGASRQHYRLAPDGRAEWVRGVLEASRESDG